MQKKHDTVKVLKGLGIVIALTIWCTIVGLLTNWFVGLVNAGVIAYLVYRIIYPKKTSAPPPQS